MIKFITYIILSLCVFFLNRSDASVNVYIAGASIDKETGEDSGWRLYRITLDADEPTLTKHGTPDITESRASHL